LHARFQRQSVANFIAGLPAEEVYHAAQERGFTWGAARAPEALLDDAHLHDRGFWKQVKHPGLKSRFVAGSARIAVLPAATAAHLWLTKGLAQI
jgi:crotonobetainyl-CoA:carnitine CoA-transferase CaiB-like acyl-CoA transferase